MYVLENESTTTEPSPYNEAAKDICKFILLAKSSH